MVKRLLVFLTTIVAASVAFSQDSGEPAHTEGNTAIQPVPKHEGWLAAHEKITKQMPKGEVPIVFVGDSITRNWIKKDKGGPVWHERYAPIRCGNLGKEGDRTEHILWRLQNGGMAEAQPQLIILLAGVNNVKKNTPEEIAEGDAAIVAELRKQRPDSKILVLAIYPARTPDSDVRATIDATNKLLPALADNEHVYFLDIGEIFVNEDGTLKDGLFADGLHPTTEGYVLIADALQPKIDELLAKPQE